MLRTKASNSSKTQFKWTDECQQAFEALKQYLGSPPLLTRPETEDDLYLYLAASDETVAAVLVKKKGREVLPVYYVSRALQGGECNYARQEKLAYALVTAARRLRPYFQAHRVTVLTYQPIRDILSRVDLSRRLMKWSMELSEYGIEFSGRKAIKAQALADFVVECTFTNSTEGKPSLIPPTLGEETTNTPLVDPLDPTE